MIITIRVDIPDSTSEFLSAVGNCDEWKTSEKSPALIDENILPMGYSTKNISNTHTDILTGKLNFAIL